MEEKDKIETMEQTKQTKHILKRILAGVLSTLMLDLTLVGFFMLKSDSAVEELNEGYYTYQINKDGTAKIIHCYSQGGDIEIPSTLGGYTVTEIACDVFRQGWNIENIKIPDSIICIDKGAFLWCTSFEVDENNPNYSSEDGVLFNKDKTELIQYSAGNKRTSYTVPNSVITIGSSAFFNSYNLKDVIIPDNVITIKESAFGSCENLERITIGNGVTDICEFAFSLCHNVDSITMGSGVKKISKSAFYACYPLNDLYYSGSEKQWKKIKIGKENDDLLNANIHYEENKKS